METLEAFSSCHPSPPLSWVACKLKASRSPLLLLLIVTCCFAFLSVNVAADPSSPVVMSTPSSEVIDAEEKTIESSPTKIDDEVGKTIECRLDTDKATTLVCEADMKSARDEVVLDCSDSKILVPAISDFTGGKSARGCSSNMLGLLEYDVPVTFLPAYPMGVMEKVGEEDFTILCQPVQFSTFGMEGKVEDPTKPYRTTYYVSDKDKYNAKMNEIQQASSANDSNSGDQEGKKDTTMTLACLGTNAQVSHVSGIVAVISFGKGVRNTDSSGDSFEQSKKGDVYKQEQDTVIRNGKLRYHDVSRTPEEMMFPIVFKSPSTPSSTTITSIFNQTVVVASFATLFMCSSAVFLG